MKYRNMIMLSLALLLSACGEENTKKEPIKTLSEYEQGYNVGFESYKTDAAMKEITNNIASTLKYSKKPLSVTDSASISYEEGRATTVCSRIAYGNASYKAKPQFEAGIQKGCMDHLSMILSCK